MDEQASYGNERVIRDLLCPTDDLTDEFLWVKRKS